jgi:hypothetical protein
MFVLSMVVLIVLIASLAKVARPVSGAMADRLTREGEEQSAQLAALRAELGATEERLALAEDRIADLDEKLRFVEGLLASPERGRELPPARPPTPGRPETRTEEHE